MSTKTKPKAQQVIPPLQEMTVKEIFDKADRIASRTEAPMISRKSDDNAGMFRTIYEKGHALQTGLLNQIMREANETRSKMKLAGSPEEKAELQQNYFNMIEEMKQGKIKVLLENLESAKGTYADSRREATVSDQVQMERFKLKVDLMDEMEALDHVLAAKRLGIYSEDEMLLLSRKSPEVQTAVKKLFKEIPPWIGQNPDVYTDFKEMEAWSKAGNGTVPYWMVKSQKFENLYSLDLLNEASRDLKEPVKPGSVDTMVREAQREQDIRREKRLNQLMTDLENEREALAAEREALRKKKS